MYERSRHTLSVAIVLGLAMSATAALAQDRPSLERIEAAMCAHSDEQGRSYRPLFCPSRCDCAQASNPPLLSAEGFALTGSSCGQQPNGRVVIDLIVEPHDVKCTGFCEGSPPISLPCTESGPFCTCTAPEGITCTDIEFFGSSSLAPGFCTLHSDCDEAAGFECSDGLAGFCVKSTYTCSALGEVCATGVAAPAGSYHFEFAPSGSLTPLACSTGGNINSSDAAACIAAAETNLGAGACIICGDGSLDPGEQCDDGNLDDGDGCTTNCTTE